MLRRSLSAQEEPWCSGGVVELSADACVVQVVAVATSFVAVTSHWEVVTRSNFMDWPPTVPLLLVEIHWRSSISENFGNLGLATTHAVILLTW